MSSESDTLPEYRVAALPRPSARPSSVWGACLVVIHGAELGRRVPLGSGPLTVGRSPRCDLQLDEDSVSRLHSRLEPMRDGTWQVIDEGSTNGTYVNDRPVRASPLHHGDQLQIGRNILKFLASGHIESAYHEEVYRMMTTDGLTGLQNRAAFDHALQREWSRASRYHRPLSLMLIDLDYFKRVNDQHGHLAGDSALRQLGALLRGNLRRDDILGRLGGEEFGVLLPEIGDEGAGLTARKLQRLVSEHRFEFDGAAIELTVSVGVASRLPTDPDVRELYRRADELLFDAKHAGRNTVRP